MDRYEYTQILIAYIIAKKFIFQQTIELTCFQSVNALTSNKHERIEIPCKIKQCESLSPACLDTLKELPQILLQEENDAYQVTLTE